MSGHHHHDRDDEKSESKTRLVVIITLIMMVAEVSYGYFTNSMALLADGWHMGTHAAALGITLYAYYYVRKEAKVKDKRDKVMALGGFASAIVLGIVAMYIGVESIGRITDPKVIRFEEALIVATVGLVVNLVCANILGIDNHHHDHKEKKADLKTTEKGKWTDKILTNPEDIEDLNRRGAYLHVLADALVSVLVILALLIGMKFSNLVILDPIIGIVAGLVIARWSIGLLIESRNQILELDG
ncbi:MAG: cation transporter [Methanobacteriota archaeon]|uniref:Cation transporter n=1 Tax=Marine Group III euryarchaeote TaxID=2173149 RepID=A0A7J4GWP9_9ARCH|nr:MAG: cation transporter [Euryarchaeota archaeon]HIF37351.1 cation transporter [Marine Group III euryarchaeote]